MWQRVVGDAAFGVPAADRSGDADDTAGGLACGSAADGVLGVHAAQRKGGNGQQYEVSLHAHQSTFRESASDPVFVPAAYSSSSSRVRAPNPVAPSTEALPDHAGPVMSQWTHGTEWGTNSPRNSAAVMARPESCSG